jgi:hypothetical protein
MKKQKEILKTQKRIRELIDHIIACIDEIDGYKCMVVREREKLKKLTGWDIEPY